MSTTVFGKLSIANFRKKVKWQPSKLVYYFVKLIGLAPFTLKNNRLHPPTRPDLCYPIGVAAVYLLLTKMAIAWTNSPTPSTATSTFVRHFVCLPTTVLTLAIIILSRDKIIRLVNELCEMSNALDDLDIDEKPGRMFNNVVASTTVANAIFAAICSILCAMEPNWDILSSIGNTAGMWCNFNVLLVHLQILWWIGRRFELVNERLSTVFSPESEDNDVHCRCRIIRKLEALHLGLCELVELTGDVFAVPMLLDSFRFFCVIVISGEFTHSLVSFSTLPHCGPEVFETLVLPNILCPLLRTAMVILEILIVGWTTARTAQEGNSTRSVLNETFINFDPESVELEDEFFMFSIQLGDKPVVVSALGILNLDYSYMYKMFSAAVSYLIIMIQFKAVAPFMIILSEFGAHGCVVPG